MGAGIIPNIPGMTPSAGQATPLAPPTSVPGVTATPSAPPAALMQALQKQPETAQRLIKSAIVSLEQAARLDSRIEPRIDAALKILRGPNKPPSSES